MKYPVHDKYFEGNTPNKPRDNDIIGYSYHLSKIRKNFQKAIVRKH